MLIGSKGTELSRRRSSRRMLSQPDSLDAAANVRSNTIVRSRKSTLTRTLSIYSETAL